MAGLTVPAAPGYNGWVKLRDGSWKTMLPSDVAEVRAALAADIAACPTCQKGGMMPQHATTYIHENRDTRAVSAHTYRCRSLSRWFNPMTRQMEGRRHCTCDACF
jgi:hypothetical protein